MSADNWRECLRCRARAVVTRAKSRQSTLDAYGKVSPEEYVQLCLEESKSIETNETFREDCEIGLYKDGTFRVNYSGGCQACGLTFQYKHEEKVDIYK